jgi:hypothetical protein
MPAMPDRRAVLGGACLATLAGAAQAATGAVRALGKAAGRVAVTGVESFDIQMPAPRAAKFEPTYLGLGPAVEEAEWDAIGRIADR